jgi:DNA-binding beta-propeller fold protein YncE
MNIRRSGCAAAIAMLAAIATWPLVAQNPSGRGTPAPVAAQRGATPARGAAGPQAPRLEVDPLWPQPFPVEKHWALGSVTGVAVDSQDHVWVTHRGVDSLQTNEKGPTLATWAAECCYAAPQVLEFDVSGKLLDSWGGTGQGYQWPQNPSGIAVDRKGNVWIAAAGVPAAAPRGRGAAAVAAALGVEPGDLPAAAAAGAARGARGAATGAQATATPAAGATAGAARGRGNAAAAPVPGDAHVIKFTAGGSFLLQIGTPGQSEGPDSTTTLSRPSALAIDEQANELFVADTGNRRIVVFDATSGKYKRHWFGSGEKTSTPAAAAYDPAAPAVKSFRDVTCVKVAADGMVYVCDRSSNRIQVFTKDGNFVKEATVAKDTRAEGSVWDLAFSSDAQQRFLYVADGLNKTVWILQRDTLTPVSRFGDGGRYPGLFHAVGNIAVDSRGNVYTGEGSEGKRVQKWINRGMGAPRPLN